MIRLKKFVFVTLVMVFALSATPALAQPLSCTTASKEGTKWLETIGIPGGHFIPIECSDSCPDEFSATKCDLKSVFKLIVNFTQVLLALTGSVAILMFVFGGTMMIVGGASGDQAKNITRGKEAIKAAVVGLVVILTAWLVVNFTILAVTGGEIGGTATIFGDRKFNEEPSTDATNSSQTISDEERERLEALP